MDTNALYEIVDKAKKYDQLTMIYKDKVLHCSFCGKRQEDVVKLIASKETYICNECVQLCNEILEDELKLNSTLE